MKLCEHWTILQAEAADRCPIDARPFCSYCRLTMVWRGCWVCPNKDHWSRVAFTRRQESPA